MARQPTVLIVDDDPSMLQTTAAIVRAAAMKPVTAATGAAALELCRSHVVDLAILDVQLPDQSGLRVLAQLRERHPDLGVVMVSVVREIPVAVEAIKLGALDYLTKDFSPSELAARISRCLEELRGRRELTWLREENAHGQKPMIAGRSAAMAAIVELADKVAAKPVTLLITGESGTGKEVLARYLHAHSDRAQHPFVAVNLAAIPDELVESTLFGHEKGAFTGASRQSLGKFELADSGTLFLDEVAELKLDVQAKLLRALQEREIERVGGQHPIPVDVRILTATNRPLAKMVAEGTFREDLFWRLKVIPIELPPLRARKEDIAELATHFLKRFAARYGRAPQTLTDAARETLESYAWPGNIRELENLIERLVVICDGAVIDTSDLPLEVSVAADLSQQTPVAGSYAVAVAAFEKSYLRKVLQAHGWHRRRAAEQLGIGYSTLKTKLKQYGLGPAEADDEG